MPKSPDATGKYVGGRVRMRRLMLELSQTELANAIGVTFQQVHKYEKGTNRIGASRLQQIAGFLQVPVSFFFGDAPMHSNGAQRSVQDSIPPEVAAFISTSDGLRLIKAFTQIKRRHLREAIVQLIQDLPTDRSS